MVKGKRKVGEGAPEAGAAKPAATQLLASPREKKTAKPRKAAKKKPSRKRVAARTGRKGSSRRRYTDAERRKILDTAKREGLTGKQVSARFGVSTLSYYLWRKKGGTPKRRGRPPGRPNKASGDGLDAMLRGQVQAKVREIVPMMVREEVSRYMDSVLGGGKG
jgi:transposase-like protein